MGTQDVKGLQHEIAVPHPLDGPLGASGGSGSHKHFINPLHQNRVRPWIFW